MEWLSLVPFAIVIGFSMWLKKNSAWTCTRAACGGIAR